MAANSSICTRNHSQSARLLQGLLRELLHLTGSNKEQRRRVLLAYGESLQQRNMFEDAAAAFLAAGALPEALRAYQLGGQWRMVFAVAGGVLSFLLACACSSGFPQGAVYCCTAATALQAARGAEGIPSGLPHRVVSALAGRLKLCALTWLQLHLDSLWDAFVLTHHCSSFACSWIAGGHDVGLPWHTVSATKNPALSCTLDLQCCKHPWTCLTRHQPPHTAMSCTSSAHGKKPPCLGARHRLKKAADERAHT